MMPWFPQLLHDSRLIRNGFKMAYQLAFNWSDWSGSGSEPDGGRMLEILYKGVTESEVHII